MEISLRACPCCGYKVFEEPEAGSFDICPVCFWEDDPVQFSDPDFEGGANSPSLRQAQRNFNKLGACDQKSISIVLKQPGKKYERDIFWKPLETLPSGTPLDPQANPSAVSKPGAARMNIDISGRKPGEKILYTGPHLCVTCADENRVMNIYLKAGETAPECKNCGTRAVWEP